MTPHEQDLIKRLDQEVKNLSILMQGTEVGDSLTLKEVRRLLYELNKGVKLAEFLKQPPTHPSFDPFNTTTTQPPY